MTMRIGFDLMRGDGRPDWLMQFTRFVQRTDEKFVWSHTSGMSDHNDPNYAGILRGLPKIAQASRPKPRVAVYSLAELGSKNADGNTSRMGADVAIPITQTASLVGTFHPDFSNVEQDQQTIQPTAFRRFFNEVRPFFAQAASSFNPFDCEVCPGVTELYTPNIPTPRRGYALEGKQGPVAFAAFDSIGSNQTDVGQTLSFRTAPRTLGLAYQGIESYAPGFADRLTTVGAFLTNRKHMVGYFNYGWDRGTNVQDNAQAQRIDFGSAYFGNDYYFGGGIRKIGKYYNPVDGLISSPDVAGWSFFGDRTLRFQAGKPLRSIEVSEFVERYHDQTGKLDRTSDDYTVTLISKNHFRLSTDAGAQYFRLPSGVFAPITQVGIAVGYLPGSATPTSFIYNRGRFGDGRLGAFTRSTTFKVGPVTSVTFEADDTAFYGDDGTRDLQWLERTALSRQLGLSSSLALGVRRIIGTGPPLFGPQPFVNASNVSFAFSKRTKRYEVYMVYGDSSLLTTKPAATIKYIYYVGGEKGT